MIRWLYLLPVLAAAQEVEVYSEFRRPGPAGEIVAIDSPGAPREILSPAVVRNGYTSFHVVLRAPQNKRVTMYLGSNPEKLVQPTFYREHFTERGVPERLERIDKQPFYELLPNGVAVFWVDLFVPRSTPVRRVRFEIQVNVEDRWVVYPMELRVQPAIVPQLVLTTGQLAPIDAPSSDTAFAAIQPYLCGKSAGRVTLVDGAVRAFIRRNASQDLAIARMVEEKRGKDAVHATMFRALGAEPGAWCAAHQNRDPEVYLKVRDSLLRMALE